MLDIQSSEDEDERCAYTIQRTDKPHVHIVRCASCPMWARSRTPHAWYLKHQARFHPEELT